MNQIKATKANFNICDWKHYSCACVCVCVCEREHAGVSMHGSGKASLKMDVINPPSLHSGPNTHKISTEPLDRLGSSLGCDSDS